jgi:hypothetical protein
MEEELNERAVTPNTSQDDVDVIYALSRAQTRTGTLPYLVDGERG